MSKCKTYWAVLHISSGTITSFSDGEYCFNAFTNKHIIACLLNDAIVDYNMAYSLKIPFFSKYIKRRFGMRLSILDFTIIKINQSNPNIRLFSGLDKGCKPNIIAMFANEYVTDD